MTATEMNEKRAKGLCFWCDEKFEHGHKCRGKKLQLFHIEVEDVEEGQEIEEEEVDSGELIRYPCRPLMERL